MPAEGPDAPFAAQFEQRLVVGPADLDDQAHVNNIVYVRWVLDVAVAHWRTLAPPETQTEIGWVALRHEIDYLRPAVLGDEIVLGTRVGHVEGITFERFVEVRRARDGRVLAKSRTLWCPVDVRTGRPRRVSAELRALFSVA